MPQAIARKSFDVSERDKRLREVIEIQRPRLTSVIRRLVRDQFEAEDVAQEVFEELVNEYDLGVTIEKVSAWLVTVAKHKIFDRFRKKRTSQAYRESLQHQTPESGTDAATRASLRQAIADALELLPPEQRDVFVKHELEGKSFKEIAAETHTPMGTLLARKKYAVDFLRDYLKEIYDDL
jgi:RNA polymerase sigma factor (sigma-70 family)